VIYASVGRLMIGSGLFGCVDDVCVRFVDGGFGLLTGSACMIEFVLLCTDCVGFGMAATCCFDFVNCIGLGTDVVDSKL
jgi:hypothetical protein